MGGVAVELGGERFIAIPERALFWPAQRTLIVADLHLGKTETFHAAGVPVPAGVLAADLDRLTSAIRTSGAERLLVLGDLVHAQPGITERLAAAIAGWRAALPIPMDLVLGNHDRKVRCLPPEWGLRILPDTVRHGRILFRHEPMPVRGAFVIGGHVHPLARLADGADWLRLPCFHIRRSAAILPAFSLFTRGVNVIPAPGDRVVAVAGDRLIDLTRRGRRPARAR